MPKKLRIMARFGQKGESLVDLEEAKEWDYDDPLGRVVVDNELINTYTELCELVARERYRDKESVNVYFLITLDGG